MAGIAGMNAKWLPGHDDLVRKLWDAGKSDSQIAVALYDEFQVVYSRNAVIGRRGRIGLANTRPIQPRKHRPARNPQIDRRKDQRPGVVFGKQPPRKPQTFTCEPLTGMRISDVIPRNVPLLELEPGDCRWPYGDGPYVFCGLPGCAGSYCDAHQALSTADGRRGHEATDTQRAAMKRNTRPAVHILGQAAYDGEGVA